MAPENPWPPVVLRVGLVGHREIRPEFQSELASTLEGVLAAIELAVDQVMSFEATARVYESLFDVKPGWTAGRSTLKLITGLAEGTDLIGAHTALARIGGRWQVDGILASSFRAFRSGFSGTAGAEAVQWMNRLDACAANESCRLIEIADPPENRAGDADARWPAHRAVATMLLEQTDLLVAVLDDGRGDRISADAGGPTIFRAGSSHETVARGLAGGLPVIVVKPDARGVGGSPHILRADDGRVVEHDLSDLSRFLGELLAPPLGEHDRLNRERALPLRLGKGILDACGFYDESEGQRQSEPLEAFLVDAAGSVAGPAIDEASDRLSTKYVKRYRRSFVAIQLLGVAAVALGLYSSIHIDILVLPWIEFMIVLAIGAVVVIERTCRWQVKATEYRVLAEALRHGRVLSMLGRRLPIPRPSAHDIHEAGAPRWTTWLLRLLLGAGIPSQSFTMDEGGVRTTRLDQEALGDRVREWIQAQIAYQRRAGRRYGRLRRILSISSSTILFPAVLVAVGFHCSHSLATSHATANVQVTPVVFAVIVLPALMAAMHGILKQGEFERLAERATAMEHFLSRELEAFSKPSVPGDNSYQSDSLTTIYMPTALDPASVPASVVIGRRAQAVARTMMEETLDWHALYRGHETEPV